MSATVDPVSMNYRVAEYAGPAVEAMEMPERMTLCNMSAELGAKTGIIASDATTHEWLERVGAGLGERELQGDPDAKIEREVVIDTPNLAPQVAAPHSPANTHAVTDGIGTRVTQAYIGACTGAKLADLRAAAKILQGRKLASSLRLLVAPASLQDQQAAEEEGLMQIFEEAGARFLATACGMCAGYGADRLGPEDVCISSTARNFKGRMGDPASRVWLASPASVAAAAVAGRLADPREMT